MGQRTDSFDLARLQLSSGEGRTLDLEVAVDPLEYGGQRYSVPGDTAAARLDVSHTTSGYSLRLRYEAPLHGPCMRCLEGADDTVSVDAREVDQPGGGEELTSPYVDEEQLDVRGWAHDALALALPTQIICTEECKGLCAVCGENLNTAPPDHAHESSPDPRWAKLSELKFE